MGPPSGGALKPNVELELPESDLREEMEDSGKNLFYPKGREISEELFIIFNSTQNHMENFPNFCPSL